MQLRDTRLLLVILGISNSNLQRSVQLPAWLYTRSFINLRHLRAMGALALLAKCTWLYCVCRLPVQAQDLYRRATSSEGLLCIRKVRVVQTFPPRGLLLPYWVIMHAIARQQAQHGTYASTRR